MEIIVSCSNSEKRRPVSRIVLEAYLFTGHELWPKFWPGSYRNGERSGLENQKQSLNSKEVFMGGDGCGDCAMILNLLRDNAKSLNKILCIV